MIGFLTLFLTLLLPHQSPCRFVNTEAHCCLRAFAALSLALPPDIQLAHTLTSFKSLLKYRLLHEAFPVPPTHPCFIDLQHHVCMWEREIYISHIIYICTYYLHITYYIHIMYYLHIKYMYYMHIHLYPLLYILYLEYALAHSRCFVYNCWIEWMNQSLLSDDGGMTCPRSDTTQGRIRKSPQVSIAQFDVFLLAPAAFIVNHSL